MLINPDFNCFGFDLKKTYLLSWILKKKIFFESIVYERRFCKQVTTYKNNSYLKLS